MIVRCQYKLCFLIQHVVLSLLFFDELISLFFIPIEF